MAVLDSVNLYFTECPRPKSEVPVSVVSSEVMRSDRLTGSYPAERK